MNGFGRWLAALCAALLLASPAAADVNFGQTPAGGKPAPGPLGYVWTGSAWVPAAGDDAGNTFGRQATPNMQVINHKTNLSMNAAAVDTSVVPFTTAAYRQMFVLVRIKSVAGLWGGALDIAVKANTSATADSTSLGWYFKMGGASHHGGRVAMLSGPTDRWQMIPLVDSTNGVPYQAPYTALSILNRAGSAIVLDLWLLGVPW